MATVTIVGIYKSLASRQVTTRQMDYVIERIETELEKRAKRARRKFGIRS